LIDVEVGDALVRAPVEILSARNAGLTGRVDERIQDIPPQALLLHPPFAAHPVKRREIRLAAEMMIFMLHESRQHVRPAPGVIAGRLGPGVIILRLAAHVDHAVDAG